MPSLPEAALLGMIQGLTEWLPVSSSGHLVLAQELLDIEQPLMLDVVLHAGSLIVILLFLRTEIASILRAAWRRDFTSESGKLAIYVIVGTVPVALVGYFLHDVFEDLFGSALAVGVALLFTGLLLFCTRFREGSRELGYGTSLLIGIAQAVALIPGISRSGATISTGLLSGIQKEKAFRFSLLLAVPAIAGAAVFEIASAADRSAQPLPLLLGAFVSMAVGYAAIYLLQRIVTHRQLHLFAYYCWAAGLAVIVLERLGTF